MKGNGWCVTVEKWLMMGEELMSYDWWVIIDKWLVMSDWGQVMGDEFLLISDWC